jgi:hypothetical protein
MWPFGVCKSQINENYVLNKIIFGKQLFSFEKKAKSENNFLFIEVAPRFIPA